MRKIKFAMLVAVTGGALFGSGCSLNGLLKNIWDGFGYGLGAIPANIIADAINGATQQPA